MGKVPAEKILGEKKVKKSNDREERVFIGKKIWDTIVCLGICESV